MNKFLKLTLRSGGKILVGTHDSSLIYEIGGIVAVKTKTGFTENQPHFFIEETLYEIEELLNLFNYVNLNVVDMEILQQYKKEKANRWF